MLLRFEGYSDDTFGEYGHSGLDHDNCASGEPIVFRVYSPSEARGLFVIGQYAPGPACGWLIGVAPDDNGTHEDTPLPDWTMALMPSADVPYSPALTIQAPEDAQVSHVPGG